MKKKILAIPGCMLLAVQCYAATAEADSLAAGRSGGAEIAVSAAASLAVNAALTEALKASVHEMRPDRSGNNSFPSRHTSWAFTASSVISRELYRYSPWWSVGAQTLASAVGLQRVRSNRHYGSDVVSGAVLGIASTEISYWLMSRIFHSCALPHAFSNDFRPGFAVASEAVYTLGGDVRTGFGMVFRAQLPLSESWGAVMSLRTASAPVKMGNAVAEPFNSYAVTIGGMGHFRLPVDCLALETTLQAGAVRLDKTVGYCVEQYAFEADCDFALNWRLTERFGVRAAVGYRIISRPDATSSFTVGIGSVALF